MTFGKTHLRISGLLLVASLAYNVWYFGFRKPQTKPAPRAEAARQAAPEPGGSRDLHPAVDPASIPPPPSVDTTSAPRWARNPFLTPEEATGGPVNRALPEAPAADPVVNSILYSGDRQLAIVDHHVVRVGDVVNGGRVVEIARDGVVLETNGTRRRVPLKPPKLGTAPVVPPPK